MEQDSSSLFPELNIPSLEERIKVWINNRKLGEGLKLGWVMSQITLYRASPSASGNFKYVLAFEILERSKASTAYLSYKNFIKKLTGPIPLDLLNEVFLDTVYKNPPNYDFREGWVLLRVSPGEAPSDSVVSLDHSYVLFSSDEGIIRNAKNEGFIKMVDLAHVLAGEEIYNDVLGPLCDKYLKSMLVIEGNNVKTKKGRCSCWINLFWAWTKTRAKTINNSLGSIKTLNLYHGEPYKERVIIDLTNRKTTGFHNEIQLDEFIEYIKYIERACYFEIPLPSWFSEDLDGQIPKEDLTDVDQLEQEELEALRNEFSKYPPKVVKKIREYKPEIEILYEGIKVRVPGFTARGKDDENLPEELEDAAKATFKSSQFENLTEKQATSGYLFYNDKNFRHFEQNFRGKMCQILISDHFPEILPDPRAKKQFYGSKRLYKDLYQQV